MSRLSRAFGVCALDAERAEEEERAALSSSTTIFAGELVESFPTLKEAKTKPKKKKKGVTVPLSQLTTGVYVGPGGARCKPSFEPKHLTMEEMLCLPTGPRERSQEEHVNSRLGGGFHSYGYGGGARRMKEDEEKGPPPSRFSDINRSSMADEVDNWSSVKKPYAQSMNSGRHDRYSSVGNTESSRADEIDNWSLGKKSAALPARSSGFGFGFWNSSVPRADSDRWERGGGCISSNGDSERRRPLLDPPKRDYVSQLEAPLNRPSPFGEARPKEAVWAEKGLDWRKMESDIDMKKVGGLTSSHSSGPCSAQSSRAGSPSSQVSGEGEVAKPQARVNPFGEAKPREVILQEKGKDWRKIDQELEHRKVDRSERDDEKILKEMIDHLKEVGKVTEANINDDLSDEIREKQKDLNDLISELDNKARFGQKSLPTRPRRAPLLADKPSAESGLSENLRKIEFADRPQSRSNGGSWARPVIERQGFQSSRDSSMDWSRTRERW